MQYVFVSYCREDRSMVLDLLKYFDEAGVPYWLDVKDMEQGEDWERIIRQKITDASAFLLCVSKKYEKTTKYIHKEVEIALSISEKLDQSIPWILPVLFKGAKMPSKAFGNMRNLDQYHAVTIGLMSGLDKKKCATRAGEILRNPSISNAELKVSSARLKSPLFMVRHETALKPYNNSSEDGVPYSGLIYNKDGLWTPFSTYWSDYCSWYFDTSKKIKPPSYIMNIEANSNYSTLIPAGKCFVQFGQAWISPIEFENGGVLGYNHCWRLSNALEINAPARSRAIVDIQDTPKSFWFFSSGPKGAEGANYYARSLG